MIEIETREDNPEDELKRAEHLVFVSLKYTRTRDVMKNAIKRMIAAFELSFDELLKYSLKNRCIKEIPSTIQEKVAVVKALLGNKGKKYFVLYNMLKKIEKAKCTGIEEFRKNVTLIAETPKKVMVKTKDLEEFLAATKEFVAIIKSEQK